MCIINLMYFDVVLFFKHLLYVGLDGRLIWIR